MPKTIDQTASRKPVDAIVDHADQNFLVFTQPGPQLAVPDIHVNGNYAATPGISVFLGYVAYPTISGRFAD